MVRNKRHRQEMARELILSGRIGSQEELLALLHEKGFACTQATLSRDLHELKAVRVPDGSHGYVYQIPGDVLLLGSNEQLRINYLVDGFRDRQFSGNLAVIRTLPGYASSIAAVIDGNPRPSLLGTIAGDDTILLILKEGITRNTLIGELVETMPYLKTKIG